VSAESTPTESTNASPMPTRHCTPAQPAAFCRATGSGNRDENNVSRYPAVLVECGFLSNRLEGGEARDSDYREALADRIAEAIVEHRYGPGVYRASRSAAAPPPSEGPGLAPSSLKRD